VSYDGITDPLGYSQVFQYLKQLAVKHEIILVSYEKPEAWQELPVRNSLINEARVNRIHWISLRYHKSPSGLATAYDIVRGILVCVYIVLRYRIQIIHARSYVAAVVALVLKRVTEVRFLFDMRGFWADERVDGGIWGAESELYRVAKWFERKFLTHADVVVSLTHAGVDTMRQFPYLEERKVWFEVIPTCTDLDLFRPAPCKARSDRHLNHRFTLGYVGSVGTWYLFDRVMECFKVLLEMCPQARMLILNKTEHEHIRDCMRRQNVPETAVEIRAMEYAEIAEAMAEMDAGIFFIKPAFSKKASSPTKLGEFLACGIPCLANAGVGDVDRILVPEEKAGVVLSEFSLPVYRQALTTLMELALDFTTADRCREVARRYFSLRKGVQRYDQIYNLLVRND